MTEVCSSSRCPCRPSAERPEGVAQFMGRLDRWPTIEEALRAIEEERTDCRVAVYPPLVPGGPPEAEDSGDAEIVPDRRPA